MASTRLVLVTGATDGIGRETALEVKRKGFRVVLHGRSNERLEATRAWIVGHVAGAHIELAKADLSVLAEVRALAADVARRFETLDVLLNNAGIYANEGRLTADSWESTWGVNHVAPFVLTLAVLPLLRAAQAATGDARSSTSAASRTVAVASSQQRGGRPRASSRTARTPTPSSRTSCSRTSCSGVSRRWPSTRCIRASCRPSS